MDNIFNLRSLQVGDVEYVGQRKKKNTIWHTGDVNVNTNEFRHCYKKKTKKKNSYDLFYYHQPNFLKF